VPAGSGKKIENGKDKMDKDDKDEDKDKGKKKDDDDEASARAPATVVIKAARDVIVTFNGRVTNRRSEEESFQTPDLVPGRSYAYQVRAEAVRDGQPVTRSMRLLVRAGGRTRVDFSDLGTAVASTEREAARIIVLLPDGARLSVDGTAYGTSSKQTFTTPRLEKGKVYHYTVKVEKADGGKAETRKVKVEAGKEVTVDFRGRSVVSADR
jgi:uncharacterized protein (TIGR03000 family)